MTWLLNHAAQITLIGSILAVSGVFLSTIQSSRKDKEIADLNKQLLAHHTASGSFVYFRFMQFDETATKLSLAHSGKYAVRDVIVEIFDITDQFPDPAVAHTVKTLTHSADQNRIAQRKLDVRYPHGNRVIAKSPFHPPGDKEFFAYFVNFYGPNGDIRQQIYLRKVEGVWHQYYTVSNYDSLTDTEVILLTQRWAPIND